MVVESHTIRHLKTATVSTRKDKNHMVIAFVAIVITYKYYGKDMGLYITLNTLTVNFKQLFCVYNSKCQCAVLPRICIS